MDGDRQWVKRSFGRRRMDRKWPRHLRDFWMVVITFFVWQALGSGQDANHHAVTAATQAKTAAAQAKAAAVSNRDTLGQIQKVSRQVARNQRSDTRALCSFRDDLQKRVDGTVSFLKTHPDGFAGIPAATLRVSLTNQQHALNALHPLMC